jgi:hypothetical protein
MVDSEITDYVALAIDDVTEAYRQQIIDPVSALLNQAA